MKNITKKKLFILGTMLTLTSLSVYVHAEEVREEMAYSKTSSIYQMLGYYYFDSRLQDPAFITMATFDNGKMSLDSEGLSPEEQNVRSARWIGKIEIEITGNYSFAASNNKSVTLMINKEKAIFNGENLVLYLEKGSYEIELIKESASSIDSLTNLDFTMKSEHDNRNYTQFRLSSPEFSSEDRSKKMLSDSLVKKSIGRRDSYVDTDDDGIFDSWEINGYSVVNRVVKPWNDELEKLGYKKYVSNPNHAHTSRDPYTDLEKVLGDVDEAMSWEARDPMVAAVPAISVGIEKVILSKNVTSGNEQGSTISREAGSSTVSSNTEGIDASITVAWPPSASVTGHFSHTNSQSVDIKSSNGKSLSSSLSLNEGEAADLNATVRYFNNGTGVVYDLKPTVNFILGKDTISTITAQSNQLANSLSPQDSYPDRRLNGIALNTLDEFSSRLIPLNFEQVKLLDNGQKLRIEAAQFSGQFVKRSSTGGNIYGGSWDMYLPQIKSTTAGITLDVGDGESIERRISAKNPEDPNDLTPVLSVRDALIRGFGLNTSSTNLEYKNKMNNKNLSLNESKVYFVLDSQTHKELERQKTVNGIDSIYDAKIFPGMNIHIIPNELLGELVQSVYNSKSINMTSSKNYDLIHSIQFHNAAFWDLTQINNYQISVNKDGKKFTGKVDAGRARNMEFITEGSDNKNGIQLNLSIFGMFGAGNVPTATTSQGGVIVVDKDSNVELSVELKTGELVKVLSILN